MSKKYGGVIQQWFKQDISQIIPQERLDDQYGPNLGFIIHGRIDDDPTDRGFAGYPLRTSLVVKWDCGPLELLQIETLNTIYDLGEARGED